MKQISPSINPHLESARSILLAANTPGVIGHFQSVELIEIYAVIESDNQTWNVFSILVFEEQVNDDNEEPEFLTEPRIKITGLKGYKFGIQRRKLSLPDANMIIDHLFTANEWHPEADTKESAEYILHPCRFVPASGATKIPLNDVLKNNFYSGSHVIEFHAQRSAVIDALTAIPSLIARLSSRLTEILDLFRKSSGELLF